MVRAKFRCTGIDLRANTTGKRVTFAPMYDTSIPEDRRYSTATPSGELWMFVDNPVEAPTE